MDLGSRQYDPLQGRFTTQDTVFGDPRSPMSLNQFVYGGDNPISMWDPNGMMFCSSGTSCLDAGGNYGPAHEETQKEANAIIAKWTSITRLMLFNDPPPRPAPPKIDPPKPGCGFMGLSCAASFVKKHAIVILAVVTIAATAALMAPVLIAAGSVLVGGGFSAASFSVAAATLSFGAAAAAGELAAADSASSDVGAAAVDTSASAAGDIEATTAKLQSHVDEAVAKYDSGEIGMSPEQARAAAGRPGLAGAYRGQVIDTAVKTAVLQDPALQGLYVTRSGELGPDFGDLGGTWWDVTTPEQWAQHVKDYTNPFGRGIPLFTRGPS